MRREDAWRRTVWLYAHTVGSPEPSHIGAMLSVVLDPGDPRVRRTNVRIDAFEDGFYFCRYA